MRLCEFVNLITLRTYYTKKRERQELEALGRKIKIQKEQRAKRTTLENVNGPSSTRKTG